MNNAPNTAVLHRMVMPGHTCPYGLKSLDLLERKGYKVEDKHLASREQTDAFKKEYSVETTPQAFIDEQRVIESVVHRRSVKLGASRVRQELQAKGLDPQAVADAVAGLQGSEEARAREVWRKKFGEPPRDERAGRAAQQDGTDIHPRTQGRKVERRVQPVLGAVDDAGIVAEHEAADGGDRDDHRDEGHVDLPVRYPASIT